MPPKAVEEDRAVEIYLKAAQIFHEKGFDATSMSDLAEAVQLTKAGLYYYIKSKQELLFAIMDYGMDSLEKEVLGPARAEPDPQARLHLIIEAHARNLTKGIKAIAILTDEVAALAPKHRKRILERKRAYFDLVRETLVALKDAGKLQDVDPTVATFSLFGMLLWLPRWYEPEGRLSRDEVIGQLTKVAIGGLLKS
jgi:TetR/AcrR family transcriptional regulator, cholesterol catabolism regulator